MKHRKYMSDINSIILRNYLEDDKSLIFSTYLYGLYYGVPGLRFSDKNSFMKKQQVILEDIIYNSNISIACFKDDPDIVLGYAIYTKDKKILHWVFSKSAWRNLGIAKMLIPESIEEVSHLTKVGLSIAYKKFGQRTFYNPFILPGGKL